MACASKKACACKHKQLNCGGKWKCRKNYDFCSLFRSSESVKFHFEECGSDVDEHRWMFCHVPGCSFWTSKSWRMERHKLCHSFETSPLDGGSNKRCYKCPDCHLKFFSLAKLLKHDRKKHTGVKDYECRICGAEVTDIQTHMRVIMLLATFQWIVII